MSRLNRLGSVTAALSLCFAVAGQPALAQSNDEAEALNDEGKELFKEQRYLEAYKRFKQATAISPQGKYYFNLCFSLNYLERFEEAITACEEVEPSGADAALLKKTKAVLDALRAKVPQDQPDPSNTDPNSVDPNNTDPNNIDPNNTDPNNVDPNNTVPNPNVGTGPAQVPGVDPFAVKTQASGAYAWSLGASVAPLANLGIGTSDSKDEFYGSVGLHLGLFGNFMYQEAQQIGLQGYLGYSNLPPSEADISAPDPEPDPLNIFDVGIAAYKHITLTSAIDITPLVGVHVSVLQPEAELDEALVALGLRAQLALDWGFGASKEHVVSIAPTINLYSPANDGNELRADKYGLDAGGASFEIGLAYQYRFTTPFGTGPIFELE